MAFFFSYIGFLSSIVSFKFPNPKTYDEEMRRKVEFTGVNVVLTS